jgi:integrase-like protein
MGKRRGQGEGSIHRRTDGKWRAIVDLGWVSGKRKRKYLYGQTRKEVSDKLKAVQHDQADGADIAPERQTVAALLDIWLEQTVRVRNRVGTYESYVQIVRSHITPAIGKYQLNKLMPERGHAIEVLTLTLATAYAFTFLLKREIGLIDTAVLGVLFLAYIMLIAKAPTEEPHLIGPAHTIGTLPRRARYLAIGGLFAFAALAIFASADPFAEGLIETGTETGIDEFLLVQLVAPFASEAPSF